MIKSYYFLLIFIVVFQSCRSEKNENVDNSKPEKEGNQEEFKSLLKPNEKIDIGKTYLDTVIFSNLDDNSDYNWFFVQKNDAKIGLIFDQEFNYVKGDELEIRWKADRISIPDDSETLAYSEKLISARKLNSLNIGNKKIKFLWREKHFSPEYNTEINSIFLNDKFIKTISDPEKAALAYIATNIGNECEWDGNPNENRSNLKCKILWALDLGYQCSSSHLSFIQYWFRNNKEIMNELTNCSIKPDGATVQDTFEEIDLEVKDNQIILYVKVSGFNLRETLSWKWSKNYTFEFKENELILKNIEVINDSRESKN